MHEFDMEFKKKLERYKNLCGALVLAKETEVINRITTEISFNEKIILNFVKYYRGEDEDEDEE